MKMLLPKISMKNLFKTILISIFLLVNFSSSINSKPIPPGSGKGDVPANILILLDSSVSMRNPVEGGTGVRGIDWAVEDSDGNLIVSENNRGLFKYLVADEERDGEWNDGEGEFRGTQMCPNMITFGSNKSWAGDITANDEISLKTNGSTRLRAHNSGVNVTGDLIVSAGVKATNNYAGDDNVKLKLGTGDDLQLYHDGNDSYIDETGTGGLKLRTSQLIARRYDNNAELFTATAGGSIDLYHNGSKKFETTSAGATVTGALTATGDVTAFSDQTLKKDITTIENAIDICSKLRGVSYKWIKDDKASIGVIAQEVEKVIPEVVHTTEHEGAEVKSVDYGKIVGVLINAINEQQAKWDVWMELLKDIRKMENKLIEVIGNY